MNTSFIECCAPRSVLPAKIIYSTNHLRRSTTRTTPKKFDVSRTSLHTSSSASRVHRISHLFYKLCHYSPSLYPARFYHRCTIHYTPQHGLLQEGATCLGILIFENAVSIFQELLYLPFGHKMLWNEIDWLWLSTEIDWLLLSTEELCWSIWWHLHWNKHAGIGSKNNNKNVSTIGSSGLIMRG